MPTFHVPSNATLSCARSLLEAQKRAFANKTKEATLRLHPRWVHVEPVALSMMAAWGAWCLSRGYKVKAINMGKHAAYAARMHLFQHLGIEY